jgi:hypothetical protein
MKENALRRHYKQPDQPRPNELEHHPVLVTPKGRARNEAQKVDSGTRRPSLLDNDLPPSPLCRKKSQTDRISLDAGAGERMIYMQLLRLLIDNSQ